MSGSHQTIHTLNAINVFTKAAYYLSLQVRPATLPTTQMSSGPQNGLASADPTKAKNDNQSKDGEWVDT